MKNILLTSILCASSIFASSNPSKMYNYEVTPFASGILSDSKAGLKDKNYYNGGISLGKNLDDLFINQVEISYMRSDNLGYKNSTGTTNINRAFINAIKKFEITDRFAAYGLAGLGYQDVTQELGELEDSPIFNYGVGLRYDIPYYGIAVKSDIRHLIATKNTQSDFMYTLGLAMPLGKKYSDIDKAKIPLIEEVVQKKETPVAQELPMEKVTINDDDRDGVLNSKDLCPNTSPGVKVNKDGCFETINLNINFDNNSAEIKNEYRKNLEAFAKMLKENNTMTAVIEAHTDSKSSEIYNQKLSERRAASVVNALKELNINSSRLKSIGYGESQPIATNDTEEGKALNRRVTALLNR